MEEVKRRQEIRYTRNGLVLLTISYTALAIIIAASIIDLLLGLLATIANLVAIVGGLLIVLGRHTFGRAHSRNAILSVLLFIVSLVTIIAGKILFGAVLSLARVNNATTITDFSVTTSSFLDAYNILYITSMIATALSGLAIVFLTYALQRKTGRIMLCVSYIAFLTLTILTTILILQGLATGFSGVPVDLQAMRYQYEIVQLLTIIPTLAFALTFYLAWSRINIGEIPEPITVKTTSTC